MSLSRFLSGLTLAAIVLAGGLASAPSAKAEDLVDFLWGGSPEYGGGRSIVSFDPQYKPGQIIVSFSDRRLYLITKPGEAMTYPVAIPTGEARWQGVTSVTSKRVNPPWTPTPDMVRAEPAPAALGAGRPSDEPAWHSRHVPRHERLPYSRHRRALDDRPSRFARLHPPDQRRRPRPLSARPSRNACDCHLAAVPNASDRVRRQRPKISRCQLEPESSDSFCVARRPRQLLLRRPLKRHLLHPTRRPTRIGRTVPAKLRLLGLPAINRAAAVWKASSPPGMTSRSNRLTSQSASHDAEQNQASRDATQDDNDQAVDQKPWDKKKASEQAELRAAAV